MEGEVLPRIRELLHRIGSKNAKFFAVMDLTSGYHQAPLDPESIPYTAFVTSRGVFEWVRVPMGLKGAPSYFQRELSMTVLKGLLGYGVELYLDDVIVYGSTEEEFLDNLKRVFQRFQEFNITLNPKKCRFGMKSIEYVGHIIDEHGIRFSKEQTDKVLNFNEPIMVKDLMSFMGLVNYFGDHIPHLAEKLKPLRDMEKESRKSKKLNWTPERRQ